VVPAIITKTAISQHQESMVGPPRGAGLMHGSGCSGCSNQSTAKCIIATSPAADERKGLPQAFSREPAIIESKACSHSDDSEPRK